MNSITLEQAAREIGKALDIDKGEIAAQVALDPYPALGWDGGKGDAPCGSIWSVEGKLLYALVRLLEPSSVIELGSYYGASTTHIAAALVANGGGKLTSVDNGRDPKSTPDVLPDDLMSVVNQVTSDGIEYLKKRRRVDFIFEDMLHSREQVAEVATLAAERLTPGGVLVSHDAAHYLVGADVRGGFADAGLEPLVILAEPSDCGLAIWRKPLGE